MFANRSIFLRGLALAMVVVVTDQLSKIWIVDHLFLYQYMPLINDFFGLTLVHNQGAAFGFLAGMGGWQRWFFTVVAVVMSLGILICLAQLRSSRMCEWSAFSLILGGAVGNVADRIELGYVIDFVLVHYRQQWYFPAFNVADAAITMGAILLLADVLLCAPNRADKANSPANAKSKGTP